MSNENRETKRLGDVVLIGSDTAFSSPEQASATLRNEQILNDYHEGRLNWREAMDLASMNEETLKGTQSKSWFYQILVRAGNEG
jgi:hypothetical protein